MNSFISLVISVFLIGFAFSFPYYFGESEAKHDAIKYGFLGTANPDANPFHYFNIVKRYLTAIFCVVVVSAGLFSFADFHRWFALFYLIYFPAAFGYNYTRKLNEARGLHTWYVSGSRKAKRFDKSIRKWAYNFHKTPQDFNQFYHFWFLVIAGAVLVCWIFFELVFGEWILRIR
jgi:hypothetical protein